MNRQRKVLVTVTYNELGIIVDTKTEVQPERKTGRWIPCSEKLPEDYENVLCWYEYFRYGDYNRMWKDYGIGYYASEYNAWGGYGIQGQKVMVIAWMPLPAPYKEVET